MTQLDCYQLADMMKNIEVGEVWGIGRRIAKRLNELGIYAVFDLARMKPEAARAEFSVVVGKTVQELRGISHIDLEEVADPKKQIISSRSFGLPMTDLTGLQSALPEFVAIAYNLAFTKYALSALETIWRPGFKYKKAGVMLMDISPADSIQGELFPVEPEHDKQAQLMVALDGINARYGRGSVKTDSIGFHDREHWYMCQERKSREYTTCWDEC